MQFFLRYIDEEPFFFVFENPYDEAKKSTLKKISIQGKVIEETVFQSNLKAIFGGIFSIGSKIYFIDSDFKYRKIDIISKKEQNLKLDFAEQPFWLRSADIDNDGIEEHLFSDKS